MLEAATQFVEAHTTLTDDTEDAMREAECDFEAALTDFMSGVVGEPKNACPVTLAPKPETLIEAQELGCG